MSLIVLEGLDGSGKGTQCKLLYDRLAASGRRVREITFPDYSSPSSSLVKMYLNGEFGKEADAVNAYAASAFYAVDRFASFRKDWGKDYAEGAVILADRYTTSNLVFQLSKLPKPEWEHFLRWLEDFEYEKLGLPRPDGVIYIDMPIEISQRLLEKRYQGDAGKKDIHESNLAFLENCRAAGLYAAEALGWRTVRCWQGEEPRNVEEIAEEVAALAGELLT